MASYTKVRTFEELCEHGAKFVIDETPDHPLWRSTRKGKKALYEMVGNKEWITQIIYQYNKLGFFTVMSQPGDVNETQLYQSHWHAMEYSIFRTVTKRRAPYIYKTDAKYTYVQKAWISGYMMRDLAEKVYAELKNNEYLDVQISCKDEPVTDYSTLTATFRNGEPMCICKQAEENDRIKKEFGLCKLFDHDENFKKMHNIRGGCGACDGLIKGEVCRGEGGVCYYLEDEDDCVKSSPNEFAYTYRDKLQNLDPKLFENNVVVRVTIFEKRWNDNSLLWTELLKVMKKHSTMKKQARKRKRQ